jgi:hypothetical protein
MNEIHVREREGCSVDELIAEWDRSSRRALRARTKLPRPIAKLPLLKLPAPVGRQSVAYLFDMGFTRDTWMHRIDLTHAAGTPFDADAAHDGRISPTSSPNGPAPTANRSRSHCPAPRVVSSPPGPAARRWSWTRSSSAASSPSGCTARASFATPSRSETA